MQEIQIKYMIWFQRICTGTDSCVAPGIPDTDPISGVIEMVERGVRRTTGINGIMVVVHVFEVQDTVQDTV